MQQRPFKIIAEFAKVDTELRVAYGWASVVEEKGELVVDLHEHVVKVDTLVRGAHDFVSRARVGLLMHSGTRIGEIVESLVFTLDVQKALEIDLGKVGWFIGMKIFDDGVWKRIKSGELRAFSFAGTAFVREA